MARVTDEWGPGIRDQCHCLASFEALQQVFLPLDLAMLMEGDERRLNSIVAQQTQAMPRVLGGDDIYHRQYFQCSRAHIAQVSYGGCDDVQRALFD
jgi:hypothetical protein